MRTRRLMSRSILALAPWLGSRWAFLKGLRAAVGEWAVDASEVVRMGSPPVVLVREKARHCASPQFAPDPVWTTRVLPHYLNSRWLSSGG
jgi:hypothetical protein